MKTLDALHLLVALEERAARCCWEMARAASDALSQRLTVAAEKVSDLRLRHRLEAMLAGAKEH